MSEKFYEYYFPCVECIVRPMCKDKDRMMEQIKVRGDVPSLGVPLWNWDEKSYHKGLLECIINILKRVTDKISRTEPANRAKGELDKIPMEYVHTLIDMADVMCHMIHTTSWDIGTLKEFDRLELSNRLDKLKHWLRYHKNETKVN
jgi:hypothetical protein